MKTKIISITTLLILGMLLFSCGTNNEPAKLNVDAFHTEAVATFASSLTQTVEAMPTTISPTPTINATITLTPTNTGDLTPTSTKNPCYELLWLEDVSIPDGTVMKSNEVFTKTWLVQNTGGCAWAPGFTFSNVGGDPMRGATFVLSKPIPVGIKYELSVEMVVPSGVYGIIQGAWRMAYEPGAYFGDTLFISITVENPKRSTETPVPTSMP